jgi:hypothetical protein
MGDLKQDFLEIDIKTTGTEGEMSRGYKPVKEVLDNGISN